MAFVSFQKAGLLSESGWDEWIADREMRRQHDLRGATGMQASRTTQITRAAVTITAA
jgi:hypothetical protein